MGVRIALVSRTAPEQSRNSPRCFCRWPRIAIHAGTLAAAGELADAQGMAAGGGRSAAIALGIRCQLVCRTAQAAQGSATRWRRRKSPPMRRTIYPRCRASLNRRHQRSFGDGGTPKITRFTTEAFSRPARLMTAWPSLEARPNHSPARTSAWNPACAIRGGRISPASKRLPSFANFRVALSASRSARRCR